MSDTDEMKNHSFKKHQMIQKIKEHLNLMSGDEVKAVHDIMKKYGTTQKSLDEIDRYFREKEGEI